jgi:hypothetical protein
VEVVNLDESHLGANVIKLFVRNLQALVIS